MVADERINLWVPTVLVVALLALHSGQLCLTVVAARVGVACHVEGNMQPAYKDRHWVGLIGDVTAG